MRNVARALAWLLLAWVCWRRRHRALADAAGRLTAGAPEQTASALGGEPSRAGDVTSESVARPRGQVHVGVFVGAALVVTALIGAWEANRVGPVLGSIDTAEPTLVVLLDPAPPPADHPSVTAMVAIDPGLFSCGPVRVDVTLDYGSPFEEAQIVGVGLAGPYQVESMSAAVAPDIGEDAAEARWVQLVEHVGGNYRAIGGKITGVTDEHRLHVSIVAHWAERRGIGACTLHTPDLVASKTNSINAEAEAADAIEESGGSASTAVHRQPPKDGSVWVSAGPIVDLDQTFPAPTEAGRLLWSCSGAVGMNGQGCDAVVAVQSSNAENVRSALLLLFGALLAFGMQVAYEAVRGRTPPRKRVG